ncbi:MAG: hypothetical protein COX19_01425 [Desulfobacterales bacterium CG23_combo_of_CG06-09_8_20_14_all_51_8]|nr:MAG: hypothetical protein COX19_01425 [Desulfobacterales bacterium CG23_combo_of_CG06-09_8_20_14_all_51_8]
MQKINHGGSSADLEKKPAPHLALEQRPEWTNVQLGENFRSDFSILEGHILVSRPAGYLTLPDIQKSLSLYEDVRRAGIPENEPYVHIIDDTRLEGASLASRKYYIDFISKQKHLLALIFCSVSPIMRLSIGLGKRIYSFLKPLIRCFGPGYRQRPWTGSSAGKTGPNVILKHPLP